MSCLDPAEIRSLFGRHGAALVLYARQWCQQPDDAVQEAFLDLVRQSSPPDSPDAWLFHVVKRKAMNLARAEQRRSKHQTFASQSDRPWFEPPPNPTLIAEDVESALTALPDTERQVVVARIWGELTFAQIGELVDMSSSAAHRCFHQALTSMSHQLEPTLKPLRHK